MSKSRKSNITCVKRKINKEVKPDKQELITCIIMCDCPGHRMKSYGPPSLMYINNNIRLIDSQIKIIQSFFGNVEIIVCVGFESGKIINHISECHSDKNIRIVENLQHEQTNSCETLRIALNNTWNNKVICIDGNMHIDKTTLKKIKMNQNCVVVSGDNKNSEIGVNISGNNVEFFSFGALHEWQNIFYVSDKSVLQSLKGIVSKESYRCKFVFEALNELVSSMGASITAVFNDKPPMNINKIKKVAQKHRRNK